MPPHTSAASLATLLLTIGFPAAPLQAQSRFQGHITDTEGAAIRAIIRVLDPRTNAVIQQFDAKEDGTFQTSPLPPGAYSLTAFASGFRRHEWRNIAISANQTISLATVALDFAGCDPPGVNCDFIGPPPDDVKRIVVQAYITLKPSCAVDLDRKPTEACSAATPATDIALIEQNNTLQLIPTNGATISPTNSNCTSTVYTNNKLPVSGLGPGVDFCVRTNKGALSHLFFVNDIDNQSTSVKLWYVTRKRR
ncbi:MAG: carboxypeptidase regulatory-like domain-containing protein [Acidobacteria bacterium]|nr:carboxypeptidase regulatory-like domain-containing protein [Acidobacteriota bacterium]